MKNRFKTKPSMNDQMILQITSMADIFMIVLIFILKSFSSSVMNITPSAGVILPQAHSNVPPVEALKVEISETAIQVEGKPITKLEKFRFLQGEGTSTSSSESLDEALGFERKRQALIAEKNSDVKVDSKIMIVAGEQTPYATLKRVLGSAATHGFTDFKLVIAKKED